VCFLFYFSFLVPITFAFSHCSQDLLIFFQSTDISCLQWRQYPSSVIVPIFDCIISIIQQVHEQTEEEAAAVVIEGDEEQGSIGGDDGTDVSIIKRRLKQRAQEEKKGKTAEVDEVAGHIKVTHTHTHTHTRT
jgi:hypothetical protein